MAPFNRNPSRGRTPKRQRRATSSPPTSRGRSAVRTPRSSPRRPASYLQNVIATAVSNGLNAISPGAGIAMDVGRTINDNLIQSTSASRRGYGKARKVTFAGKVRKSGKKVRKDVFAANGFRCCHELNGTINDENACYLNVQAYGGYMALELLMHALLRRLFAKAGCTVAGIDDKLVNSITGSAGDVTGTSCLGWRISLKAVDQHDQSIEWQYYDTAADETIGSIAGKICSPLGSLTPNWSHLYTFFRGLSAGGGIASEVNVLEPTNFFLHVADAIDATAANNSWRQVANLNLKDEVVVFQTKIHVKMQNRSLSASGNVDSEAVDSNPLYMKKYLFSGAPRMRTTNSILTAPPLYENNFPLPDATTGMATMGASVMELTFREPPAGNLFWNCTKTASDKIGPGQLKQDTFYVTKKMKLIPFVRTLRHSTSATGNEEQTIQAPTRVYAFDDMINLNSTNQLTIAFEVQRDMAMYTYSNPSRYAKTSIYTSTINEDGAPTPIT